MTRATTIAAILVTLLLPGGLWAQTANVSWDSGKYYDPAGNITSIGPSGNTTTEVSTATSN